MSFDQTHLLHLPCSESPGDTRNSNIGMITCTFTAPAAQAMTEAETRLHDKLCETNQPIRWFVPEGTYLPI